MLGKVRSLSAGLTRLLSSKWCWRVVLGLFVLQAVWFVFSAQYPMAFDENYHLGLIQLHAQQWLPFFTHQPEHAGVYGAIVRDPSYLYHWLMSFPYRLVSVFTHNQTAQVIVLRLINVALFTYGLLLYRRVIRRIGASRALANSLFAVFVLIPVVPFLAAHINYDNLFFVALPLTILLALRLLGHVQSGTADAVNVLVLLSVLCLASLVKYPFLPIAAVTGLYVLWRMWRARLYGAAAFKSFWTSLRALSRVKQVVLVAIFLLSAGLFAERYAVNLVQYHNPVPACDAVISQDECAEYGPYSRDVAYAAQKPASFHPHMASYVPQWLYGMWYRLFFAINYDYATAPPLLVISVLALVLAALLAAALVWRYSSVLRGHPTRQFLLLLTIGYVLVLFADGYRSYAKTGQPVAINGRYLIPFLPLVFALGGLAWSQLLRKRATAKALMASVVIAAFLLQGGGAGTFLVRSADTWMWPNSTVRTINRTARSIAWPLIIGKGVY